MARKKTQDNQNTVNETVKDHPFAAGDQAPYFFHQGASVRAGDYLGPHLSPDGDWTFRVWAPHAESVFLTGDFNGWDDSVPMYRVTDAGVWERRAPSGSIPAGSFYKYRIVNHGEVMLKADPYAVRAECPPGTASVVWDLSLDAFEWHDEGWLAERLNKFDANVGRGAHGQPLHIYEMQATSWRRHEDGSCYNWRELAQELAPYVKQMGYTHVELLPVMDAPYDGSWGYQICGYYAPSARMGTPNDLMFFIDYLHNAGVGVILDWVPAHFPKDAHGLYEFDGEPLYEYQGRDRMESEGWGTRRFDVGRPEIESFLVSNALFWVEKYHADGLRVDAVASMLYLDYDRRPGEWVPNVYGTNICLEAVAFFQKMNAAMRRLHPDVMTIAEESGSQVQVTGFANNGLGFTYKWDMGWMNDTLAYAALDPYFRSYNHDKLTFGMMYAYSEKFVLPISHDEVVHGKKSFLDKMPGTYEEKFAGVRLFMTYMMTRPGKKLTFMGSEIGQFREWDYAGQVEWFLTKYPSHDGLKRFWADLGHFYLSHQQLWQIDDGWSGFQWIDVTDKNRSILAYRRIDTDGRELLVCLNFAAQAYPEYRMGVPADGEWREIFTSEVPDYGGSGVLNGTKTAEAEPCHDMNQSIVFHLAPLAATVWEYVGPSPKKPVKKTPAKKVPAKKAGVQREKTK